VECRVVLRCVAPAVYQCRLAPSADYLAPQGAIFTVSRLSAARFLMHHTRMSAFHPKRVLEKERSSAWTEPEWGAGPRAWRCGCTR
jgi:hypothetical protein